MIPLPEQTIIIPMPQTLRALALLLALTFSAACSARQARPESTHPALGGEGVRVHSATGMIWRGTIGPGQTVHGDLLRGDSAAEGPRLGRDRWVFTAREDGPVTVRIDLRRRDTWLTYGIVYDSLRSDQYGVTSHQEVFRVRRGTRYYFEVAALGSDSASRESRYTLRLEGGAPLRRIGVGQSASSSLGDEDQTIVAANQGQIYYFEDWLLEGPGTDPLAVRMEAPGEGTLALGTPDARGEFQMLRFADGARPLIVFRPERGREYRIRVTMSHQVMDRGYTLAVERIGP